MSATSRPDPLGHSLARHSLARPARTHPERRRRAATRSRLVAALALVVGTGFLVACQPPALVLSGSVAGSGSEPVAGVPVAVFANGSETVVATTVTDADGHYLFRSDRVPGGTYRIRFAAADWWSGATTWADATPVTASGSSPATVDATIDAPTIQIGGTIGAPIGSEFSAVVVNASTLQSVAAIEVNDGTFAFFGLHETGYKLLVWDRTGLLRTQVYGTSSLDPASGTTISADADVHLALAGQDCDTAVLFPGADLSGADLHGRNLIGCALGGADLSGANLSGANLQWADLTGADLSGADLSGADLTSASAPGATFAGATFTGTVLLYSYLEGADLTGANLAGHDLSSVVFVDAVLANATLTNATLDFADFTGATLAGADLDGASLSFVDSGGIVGTPGSLPSGWSLRGGFLFGPFANLGHEDFSGFDLSGLSLHGANFFDSDLSGSNLTGADMSDTNLGGTATVASADLTNANFVDADLSPSGGSSATYANTTCPDGTVAPAQFPTCVGHGFSP